MESMSFEQLSVLGTGDQAPMNVAIHESVKYKMEHSF